MNSARGTSRHPKPHNFVPAVPVPPYSVLAALYDVVMEHVEYDAWAELVDHYFATYADEQGISTILELGAGTGSLAFELQPLGPYTYHATDASESMIQIGERKAAMLGMDIHFEKATFQHFHVKEPVDAIVLLFDGLNYLLDTKDVLKLFSNAYEALRPGGLFLFDISTPANSEDHEADFAGEGEVEGVTFVRGSQYDRATKLHTTTFDIFIEGQHYFEKHIERAYAIEEIRTLLPAGFEVLDIFDGFSEEPATDRSHRAHFLVRRVA